MNIGWIFLIGALIILAFLAFGSQRRNGPADMMASQERSFRLDELDARLVRRDEITSFLQAGEKLRAIKTYREDTGASLADARAAVERMALSMQAGIELQAYHRREGHVGTIGDALNSEIERQLLQGNKILAIKLYREQTGVGLREAKEAVEHMANEVHLRGPSFALSAEVDTEALRSVFSQSAAFSPGEDVRGLVLEGKKIQAIKLYREQTGVGLREAKEAVEQLERTLHLGIEQE